MSSNIFESPECSCLTEPPEWLDNFSDNAFCNHLKRWESTIVGVSNIECPMPTDYGMSCKNHDLTTDTACTRTGAGVIPDYCHVKWCMVDKDKCFSSNATIYEASSIRGLYYSYDVCSNNVPSSYLESLAANRLDEDLKDYNIDIVLPGYIYPYHFEKKPEFTYPEYDYTNLQGIFIDYYDMLREKMMVPRLNYKLISGGSRRRTQNLSTYSSAISDVQHNLADLAGGGYWATPDRMKNVSFSLPLYTSPIYVYELRKSSGNGIITLFYKTLQPFSNDLWLALIICILMAGLANVCTSRARGHQEWHRILDPERNRTFSKRAISTLRVSIDSFVRSFIEYSNQASELVMKGTISHKLIVFGFGFFILVVSSSYTANLATFLTMNILDSYITDVQNEVVGSNLKVCLQDAIIPFVHAAFEGIHKKNIGKIIPKADFDYIRDGIDNLKNGTCDLMFADEIDLKFIDDEKNKEFICNSGLVSIKTKVMDLSWSIPVRSEFFQSLNWAMFRHSEREVDFADILNSYQLSLDCDIYLESGSTETSQIRSQDMALPFTILLLCFFIGIISKLLERRNRNPSDIDEYFDNHIDDLDLMEYKYRLELITLNTQRLSKNMAKYMQERSEEIKID